MRSGEFVAEAILQGCLRVPIAEGVVCFMDDMNAAALAKSRDRRSTLDSKHLQPWLVGCKNEHHSDASCAYVLELPSEIARQADA
jgi:hypothetical protein